MNELSEEIHLSKKEYLARTKHILGMRAFYTSSLDKVFVFHGGKNGEIYIPKFILLFYHILGYRFFCCYPSQVRDNVGFGEYMFLEHDGEMKVSASLDVGADYFDMSVVLSPNYK